MGHPWFRMRGYRHFDAAVGQAFAQKAHDPDFVAKHSWLPLIHYIKRVKRYKPKDHQTVFKNRDIMFASHRDACILSKYSFDITQLLDKHYVATGLDKHVIAYRKLGRANYHFSADAYRFAKNNSDCVVLCFDITGFFDNLHHGILKARLKELLGVKELSKDWYSVFRHVTKFSKVERRALEANAVIAARLKEKSHQPLATISEILAAGIQIETNPKKVGIPQGTPISSALSNVYMMHVDRIMVDATGKVGGLYQRYSDDILLICPTAQEAALTNTLKLAIEDHRLEIKDEKTERAEFGPGKEGTFQYLGFNVDQDGATIRPSSLSRLYRKAKRAIKKTRRAGNEAIAKGRAGKIYTKKLRKRFQPVGSRNFSKYARRSSEAFGSKKILRQVRRFEVAIERAIRELDEP